MVLVKNITALIVVLLLISIVAATRADPIVRLSNDQADCCSDPNTVGTNLVRKVNVNPTISGVVHFPSWQPSFGKLLNTRVTFNVFVDATFTAKGSTVNGPRVVYTETPTITFNLEKYHKPPVLWTFAPYGVVCEASTCQGVEAPGIWTYEDARVDDIVATSDPTAYGGDIPFSVSGQLEGLSGEAQATEKWILRGAVARVYEPPTVNIYADAFIPDKTVPNPLRFLQEAIGGQLSPAVEPNPFLVRQTPPSSVIVAYKGDNRGFQQFGSSRIYQAITVDLNPNDPPIVSQSHDTGVSVAIRANGKEITGKAPTTGLIEKVFTSGGAVSVNLHGEAGNPLSSPAPAIIQDYTINLSTDDGNTIDYDIVGHTKFYPAYEIYIGCRLITGVGTPYMPPPGTTAASLVFPALRPVEAHGQISASDASGCDPPGLSFPPVRP